MGRVRLGREAVKCTLPPETARRLRQAAAARGVPLGIVLEEAIRMFLNSEDGTKGKRPR